MEHSDLIESLGGNRSVADEVGAKPTAVANWRKRGIPWKYRVPVGKMAATRGVVVPSGFWDTQEK